VENWWKRRSDMTGSVGRRVNVKTLNMILMINIIIVIIAKFKYHLAMRLRQSDLLAILGII